MNLQLFTNNALTLSAASISPSDTTLTVKHGTGSLFPTITESGDYFLVTLENPQATLREIVKVTARSGDTFTIVRAQEGMTALAWHVNTVVDSRITAGTLENFIQDSEGTGGGSGEDITGSTTITGLTSAIIDVIDSTTQKYTKWIVLVTTATGLSSFEVLALFGSTIEYTVTDELGEAAADDFSIDISYDVGTPTDVNFSVTNLIGTSIVVEFTRFYSIVQNGAGTATIAASDTEVIEVVNSNTKKTAKWLVVIVSGSLISSFEISALFGSTLEYFIDSELGDAFSDFTVSVDYDIGVPTNVNLSITNLSLADITATFVRI